MRLHIPDTPSAVHHLATIDFLVRHHEQVIQIQPDLFLQQTALLLQNDHIRNFPLLSPYY
jgi:hypothetical protein